MERLERRTDVLTTNDAPGAEPPDLTDLVGFSRADLLQNRADQLSQDQTAELTGGLQGRAIGGAVLLALAGLFVYLHGLTLVNLLWLIGLGFYLYGMVDRYRELRAGVVDRVEGDAWGERDNEGDSRLNVGDANLLVTAKTLARIPAGGPYRFYYVPRSKTVVGGEALPGWRAAPSPAKKPRPWWFPRIEFGGD